MFQVRRQTQFFDYDGAHIEDEPIKGNLDHEVAVRMAKIHNQQNTNGEEKQRRFDDRLLKITVYYVQPMKVDGRKKQEAL